MIGFRWETLVQEYGDSRTADPTLFDLTVDLADSDFKYIYRAAPNPEHEHIDLRKRDKSLNPSYYFEKVSIEEEGAEHSVLLEERKFYIMKSKERLLAYPVMSPSK